MPGRKKLFSGMCAFSRNRNMASQRVATVEEPPGRAGFAN